jgi:hypothetical protein
MPRRKVPPSSDSARARNVSGTRVVMNECRARPNAAAQKPMTKTDAASTAGSARGEPRDAADRDAAADRHRHPLADAGDGPAGGDVAAQLPDDEGGGDECGGRHVGAEARRDPAERDDGALAEGEEHGRTVDHGREAPEHAPHRGGSRHPSRHPR